VTDHRSGVTVYGIEGIMEGGGNLEKIMQSVQKWMTQAEIEELMATSEG
jgi:peptide chain release factor 1